MLMCFSNEEIDLAKIDLRTHYQTYKKINFFMFFLKVI